MSDLISRADAISVLIRWLSGEGGDIVEQIESLPSASVDVVEVIHDMEWVAVPRAEYEDFLASAEAVQGEWIPVSERLPEVHPYKDVTGMTWDESDDVLICMNYGNMHVATYEVDSESAQYWVDKDGLEYTGVTAWMPLPKPYEGSESHEID